MSYVRCDGLFVLGVQIEPCEEHAAYHVLDLDTKVSHWLCPHHYAHFVATAASHEVVGAFEAESERRTYERPAERTRKQPDSK